MKHIPVMLNEVVKYLNIKNNGFYIDATFGSGGHSTEILKYLNSKGHIIAFDKIIRLKKKYINTIELPFDILPTLTNSLNINIYNGIIIDLGFSTPQIKDNTGISFKKNNFLDMRFNISQKIRVIDWINNANENEILDVFSLFGNKKIAYQLTSKILEIRKQKILKTSNDITVLIKNQHYNKIFNLIRIFINNEIEHLRKLLENVNYILKKNAIIIIISFNSLEDKIIKDYMLKKHKKNMQYHCIFKPQYNEINRNIKSRSSIMRLFKKI